HPYWTLFPPALPFLCSNRKADIIHTAPDYGLFFKRRKTPLILTFHGFVLDKETRPYGPTLQKLHYSTDLLYFTRKSLEVADKVTCVSKFIAEMVKRELNYTKPIQVIYNGIDTNMFKPGGIKKNGQVNVLFCGHPTSRKGAHLLPKIAENLNPGITIQYTRGFRNKAYRFHSPSLVDLGSVKYSDMPAVYMQADILVFPTLREGFGLVAAEAMACGLPVVASNCSSLPELIEESKGGYLCELNNAGEFAARINQLADSAQMRKEMGQYNRNRIEEKFTLQKMTESYRKLFEEILLSR
ncbi:MAG: glycosyltransferase family 4 protein, partial [Deltaproteobacteria bacterium]|nr:glycosyltransferase family 4 protein [Deltaproteobacteria bacterium]